jgi:benzodiazapine receptor
MGYASHRAFIAGRDSPFYAVQAAAATGATLYTVQLALNLAWMPLFFGIERPIEAAVDILALTGTVAALAVTWWDVDRVASYLLLPYLGWLGFANYLCIGTGHLNGWDFKNAAVKAKGKARVE